MLLDAPLVSEHVVLYAFLVRTDGEKAVLYKSDDSPASVELANN